MDATGRPPTSHSSNSSLSRVVRVFRVYTRLLRDGKAEMGRALVQRSLFVVDGHVRSPRVTAVNLG